MSTNSYRINKKIYAKHVSFSGHEEKLREFFDERDGISDKLNIYGCGEYEVSLSTLIEAVNKAKELELDKDTIKMIEKDIKWAKLYGREHIQYDHF